MPPLRALQEHRSWALRLFGLGALTILVYLAQALFKPGTLLFAPFKIQDDARQFQLWMPRLADPTLMSGDRIAAYWHDVSPPLYRLVFEAAARLGIDPVLFGRLLPVPLLAATVWASWRVALRLTGKARTAFFAAAFMLGYLTHDDSIFSATPRAFSPLLLLLLFDALLARRLWRCVPILALLGALYPMSAVAGLAIMGVRQLERGGPLGLRLPIRAIAPIALAAAGAAAAALPGQLATHKWGPVLTLEQALAMPNTGLPGGRSSIVGASGRIGWICSARMGFVPEVVPCHWGIPGAPIMDILLLAPLLLLAWKAARGRPDPQTARRNNFYLHALIASGTCFAIAALLAFRFHMPSRYSQRILGPLEWLAIGQALAHWVGSRGRVAKAAIGGLLLMLFAVPTPGFVHPADPKLFEAIRRLPRNVRIGGVSDDLSAVPALTGRAISGTPELAIPWHTGYYRGLEGALQDSLLAVSTHDPAELEAVLNRASLDYLVVDRSGVLPPDYARVVPNAVRAAEIRMRKSPLALRYSGACAVYAGREEMLIDAHCLRRMAQAQGRQR